MSEEKKINFIRYVLLLVGVGLLLSIVSMLVQQLLGISSPFIGGAIVGGGIVLAITAINRSIANGGCVWLLNK